MTSLRPGRLPPPDPTTQRIACALYETVADAPIVSPHGHAELRWWSENPATPDPGRLFVTPDHYVTWMLVSQSVPFKALEIGGIPATRAPRPTEARSVASSGAVSTCSVPRRPGSGSSMRWRRPSA